MHCSGEPGPCSVGPFAGSGVWCLLQTEQALPLQPQSKCFTPQPSQWPCADLAPGDQCLSCVWRGKTSQGWPEGNDCFTTSPGHSPVHPSRDAAVLCWFLWNLFSPQPGNSQPSVMARGCRTLHFSLLIFMRFPACPFLQLSGSPVLGHFDWSPALVLSIYKILPCISSRAISAIFIIVEIKQHYLDSVFWQYRFLFIS